MRVFMLGWEFPPFISGGLGTACYGLTKALSGLGTDVMFVLPRPAPPPEAPPPEPVFDPADAFEPPSPPLPLPPPDPHWVEEQVVEIEQGLRADAFTHVKFYPLPAQLGDPYQPGPPPRILPVHSTTVVRAVTEEHTLSTRETAMNPRVNERSPAPPAPSLTQAPVPAPAPPKKQPTVQYGVDLFAEVQRYSALAADLAKDEDFDVVHAHDWMTFPAGMAVAAARGVPLVVHVHSTEFDRSGTHVDPRIYDIERRGMHAAVRVVAVSFLTKNQITHRYGVEPSKVDVVYNAIETNGRVFDEEASKIHKDEKIVLFLGRITHQKGPEYFLSAARKVLEVMQNVKFVMAGSGDLTRRTIEMAAELNIGHKVIFTGFLRGPDIERVFRMADLYVMPSVSEPFGIAPLEAMSHDVPVLISKQSGVSEVLRHALKVDFWDTTEMANKIVAVLKHPPLASTLRQHGSFEVSQFNWTDVAEECLKVYERAQEMMGVEAESATAGGMPENEENGDRDADRHAEAAMTDAASARQASPLPPGRKAPRQQSGDDRHR